MPRQSRLRAAILGALILVLGRAQMTSRAWAAPQDAQIQHCESCHGPGGDSKVTTTPRLNGQQAGYITARLKTLSTQTQKNAHARIGMFKDLAVDSDAARSSLANYFSGQAPTSPKPGAGAAEGKQIYESGSSADNVISCNQCHGAQGEGHDATPRLAGQHADYLKAQLRLFNLKFRPHVLMKANTQSMTEKTMDALIAYLAND